MSFPRLSTVTQGYLIAKAAKGLSDNTIRNYRNNLNRFVGWLDDPPIDAITSRQIEAYFKYLNDEFRIVRHGSHKIKETRPLSAKSIQNAWAAINNFWKWASAEFEVSNPFKIPFIKANTKPVDPVPQEEIEKLLKACDYVVRAMGDTRYRSRRSTAKRDRAIILLLVDSGLRVSELCDLRIENVDFQGKRAYVKSGKGDKARFVYFGKVCSQAMWRYFVERFPAGKARGSEPFFVINDDIHPMDRHSVRLIVRRLGKKVGDPGLHPHRFRHTFAIQFLRNGGNIFELQQLLGHSSLEMVQHYARLAETDLENAAMRSSPADHWKL